MEAPLIGSALVILVGLQHILFGVLEMFLWTTPLGRKIFRTDEDFAEKSRVLAANQGLYNFFLAAGLLVTFFLPHAAAFYFRYFFMTCVCIAGIYGGVTVHKRVALFQAGPALFGLFVLVMGF